MKPAKTGNSISLNNVQQKNNKPSLMAVGYFCTGQYFWGSIMWPLPQMPALVFNFTHTFRHLAFT